MLAVSIGCASKNKLLADSCPGPLVSARGPSGGVRCEGVFVAQSELQLDVKTQTAFDSIRKFQKNVNKYGSDNISAVKRAFGEGTNDYTYTYGPLSDSVNGSFNTVFLTLLSKSVDMGKTIEFMEALTNKQFGQARKELTPDEISNLKELTPEQNRELAKALDIEKARSERPLRDLQTQEVKNALSDFENFLDRVPSSTSGAMALKLLFFNINRADLATHIDWNQPMRTLRKQMIQVLINQPDFGALALGIKNYFLQKNQLTPADASMFDYLAHAKIVGSG